MSLLGKTFYDKYIEYFQYISKPHTLQELINFINNNNLSANSKYYDVNLNSIDPKNLNILFYIIITSNSDEDCYQKLKTLIEQYNVNFNAFDFIHFRKLPFYSCVKGYLKTSQYLIEKLNFDIKCFETGNKTLFFSAIKSYNIELMKYLDNKYPSWIFYPDDNYNSCIYEIFKKNMTADQEKLKNVLRFIIKRGFDLNEVNNDKISFKDKCKFYKIENLLNEVIIELGGKIENEDEKANKNNQDNMIIEKNDKNVINDKKNEFDKKEKDNISERWVNAEKNNKGNNNGVDHSNMLKIKLKKNSEKNLEKVDKKNEKINNLNLLKNNFELNEEKKEIYPENKKNKEFNINNNVDSNIERRLNMEIIQRSKTQKKYVCAFLSKKRHNIIIKHESLEEAKKNEYLKYFFLRK